MAPGAMPCIRAPGDSVLCLIRAVFELLAVECLVVLTPLQPVLRRLRLVSAKFFAVDLSFARFGRPLLRLAIFVKVDDVAHECLPTLRPARDASRRLCCAS